MRVPLKKENSQYDVELLEYCAKNDIAHVIHAMHSSNDLWGNHVLSTTTEVGMFVGQTSSELDIDIPKAFRALPSGSPTTQNALETMTAGDKEQSEGVEQVIATDEKQVLAKCFVDKLRRTHFGIGVVVEDEEVKNLLEETQNRNQRAINGLAENLYSEDTHFVLELIQNADDNRYEKRNQPRLELHVSNTHIRVFNNEKGFRDNDISAICDVNKSTKKGKAGYIGQKGIGFKSVFRVSDFPELHSSDYHIQFDVANYIVPTWLEGP